MADFYILQTQTVEIFIYVSLAADFFYNFAHGKIVKASAAPPMAIQMDAPRGGYKPADAYSGTSYDGRGEMSKSVKTMSYALIFSTLSLFVRAVYRAIAVSTSFRKMPSPDESSQLNSSVSCSSLLDFKAVSTVAKFCSVRSFAASLKSYNLLLFSPLRLIDLLDGLMIVLAAASLNIFHPGYLLNRNSGREALA